MGWRKLTFGKKIAVGFGTVLILLAVVGALSYLGVKEIVGNAGEVIEGNKLDGSLAQKEVDHLNWVNHVNALLTDDKVTTLNVETDDHKCGFGKWLFGEGRSLAENRVPSLAPLFKAIEIPHKALHKSAIAIGENFRPADSNLPGFLAAREVDHLKWASAIRELFLANLPELAVETDPTLCAFGKWLYSEEAEKTAGSDPELGRLMDAIKEPHRRLHESASKIRETYAQIHPGLRNTLKDRLDDHRRWAETVSRAIIESRINLDVETDPTQCAFGKFLASPQTGKWMNSFPPLKEFLEAVKEPHDRLHESALAIQNALKMGDKTRATEIFTTQTSPALEKVAELFFAAIEAETALQQARAEALEVFQSQTLPALEQTSSLLGKMKQRAEQLLEGVRRANQIYASETMPALEETQKLLNDIRAEAKRHIMTDQIMLKAARGTERNVTISSIAAIVIGIFMAFIIARGIIKALTRIAFYMDEGAEQVFSAAAQVSSASQSLAEGASQQAAGIEQTSSSLEEMSSMTRQNADNAETANRLMKESNQVVDLANNSMVELIRSMEDISKASEETSKIIKTIDEIAFQTNLLALNAAVEAARAGEAGAGFAVVADEVRNLAMRAAEAAKNTSNLIQSTLDKIEDGSQMVAKTNTAFQQVADSTLKVGQLVGEISVASDEQSKGIGQVNQAVAEMDKVTQQNAANAEESASAAEELSAQAAEMKGNVDKLMALVGGARKKPTQKSETRPSKSRPVSSTKQIPHASKKVKPGKLIPFEEDDFSDF